MTTPSISYSRLARFSRHSSMNASTSSSPWHRREVGFVRSPQERSASSASHWLRGEAPLTWAMA